MFVVFEDALNIPLFGDLSAKFLESRERGVFRMGIDASRLVESFNGLLLMAAKKGCKAL